MIPYQTYDAILKISYSSCNNHVLLVNLTGNGCVPEIVLIEPKFDEKLNTYYVRFTPAIFVVSEDSKKIFCAETKKIIIKNIGVLPCKVIAEICNDTYNVLSIVNNNTGTICENCNFFSIFFLFFINHQILNM